MTLDHTRVEDGDPGTALGQRVLLHWRVRCGVRRAAVAATAGPDAVVLCAAVAWTLQHGSPAPDLASAARAWAEGVPVLTEARSALMCLGEVASELGGELSAEIPLKGLDAVLEQLASAAIAASAGRSGPVGVDALTGCRDRRGLDNDLAAMVAGATAAGADVAVAMVEIDDATMASLKRSGKLEAADDVAILSLVATMRRMLGRADLVYRAGTRNLAAVVPGTDKSGVGELMLLATCAPGPGFSWGAASLRAAGSEAVNNPNLLSVLAQADLELRRRDFSHANAMLVSRRRRSALASVAAVTVLLGGIALGVDATGGGPETHPRVALPKHPNTAAPARPPGAAPTTSVPASAPAPSVPASVPSAVAVSSPPAPPGPSSGTTSAPAATISLVSEQVPPPAPPPASPPAPPTLSLVVSPAVSTLGGPAPTVTVNASDATSGVTSFSCASASTASVGTFSIMCRDTNKAGLTGSASVSYTVANAFLGYQSPPPSGPLNGRATIRVTFALGNYQGTGQTSTATTRVSLGSSPGGSDLGTATCSSRAMSYHCDLRAQATVHSGTPYYLTVWQQIGGSWVTVPNSKSVVNGNAEVISFK